MRIDAKDIIAHTAEHVVFIENGLVYTMWNTPRDGAPYFTERAGPRAERIWLDIHNGIIG